MKKIILVLGILFQITSVSAKGPGTAGGIVLNYPVGAQPIGMGEAFVSAVCDVNAIFWNPAGLDLLNHKEFIGYYSNGLVDTSYKSVGYAQPTEFGVIGYGLSTLDGGEATIYYPEGMTKIVKAQSDYILMLSYAGEIPEWIVENLSIGGNLKIIHSELAETSKATAFACDLGGLYRLPVHNLSIGGVIQNIGSKMKYEEESDALPLNIKLGGAYRRNDLLVSLDIIKPIENEIKVNLGLEYWIIKTLALRTGYKSDNKAVTLGTGLKISNYQLDYAYVPHQDLGDTHQISLLAKF